MTRITIDQMFDGLLAELTRLGVSTLSLRTDKLDEAIEWTFQRLEQEARRYELDIRFRISRDLHGESTAVREAIARAAQRNRISLDNPEYQDLRIKRSAANIDTETLPGGAALYQLLARAFLESYEGSVEAHQ